MAKKTPVTSDSIRQSFDLLQDFLSTAETKEAGNDAVAQEASTEIDAAKSGTVATSVAKGAESDISVDKVPANKPGEEDKNPPQLSPEGPKAEDPATTPPELASTAKENIGNAKEASAEDGPTRLDRLAAGLLPILDKTAREIDPVYALDKEAEEVGSEFAQWYRIGRMQKVADINEMMKVKNIPQALIDANGGIEGLLNKTAMVQPQAVVPDELMPELQAAQGAPEGMPPDAGMDPAAGAPEGMPGAEGDMSDEEALASLGQLLSDAGVTEEELQQMVQQIADLKNQGMSDEQILQALTELADEQGPDAAPEAGLPPEAAAEAPVEPEPGKEAADQTFRKNVEACKQSLKGGK